MDDKPSEEPVDGVLGPLTKAAWEKAFEGNVLKAWAAFKNIFGKPSAKDNVFFIEMTQSSWDHVELVDDEPEDGVIGPLTEAAWDKALEEWNKALEERDKDLEKPVNGFIRPRIKPAWNPLWSW